MRLYLDENIGSTVTSGLRTLGHDVMSVHEHQVLHGLTDHEHAALAQQTNRVLVTQDRDFCKIWELGGMPRTGVIWFTKDMLFSESHRVRLYHAIKEHAAALEAGAFITVGPWRTRVRPLQKQSHLSQQIAPRSGD